MYPCVLVIIIIGLSIVFIHFQCIKEQALPSPVLAHMLLAYLSLVTSHRSWSVPLSQHSLARSTLPDDTDGTLCVCDKNRPFFSWTVGVCLSLALSLPLSPSLYSAGAQCFITHTHYTYPHPLISTSLILFAFFIYHTPGPSKRYSALCKIDSCVCCRHFHDLE
ncbi:MAG: hypothetical protein J3R72DRAFT_55184 [Linnemannia gamsii]|nr:MAG: hypothetical protein J3R72DRAFT_55184 [Linnemannia gamsii]